MEELNEELLQAKVKAYNERQGSLIGYDCPKCKNRGDTAEIKNGYMVIKICECQNIRRNIRRIHASGLEDLINDYTFERFETPERWQVIAKAKAQEYIADGAGKWFVAMGKPGTGKSHICTAIAGTLLNAGRNLRYMLWRSDAARLKSMITDTDAYQKEISEYKNAQVLYIDDFWKGAVSAADVNLAFELLNERYARRKTMTIISTERSMEELLSIDESIGSRIYERSKGYCVITGSVNWRLRNGK